MTVAAPTSLNFDDVTTGNVLMPTTIGGFVFSNVSTLTNNNVGGYAYVTTQYNNSADHFLEFYGNFGLINNVTATTGFAITAANGSTFTLDTMKLLATDGTLTVSGYDAQGVLVTSDTITRGVSDSTGSITYVSTPDQWWGATGTMTFGHDWSGVSKVTFTEVTNGFLLGQEIAIDDIVLKGATVDLASGNDSGSSGTDHITNVAAPVLSGSADNNAVLDVFVDGATTASATLTANADGSFTFAQLPALSDGVHTVTVTEQSDPGMTGSVTFTVDTVALAPAAPTLDPTSDSGIAGDGLTSDFTPLITGTAEANASVTLYEGSHVVGTATANSQGAWQITTIALADGAHALTAQQTDVAGNTSVAGAALEFTVASGRPSTPTLLDASDSGVKGDNITNARMPTLTGTGQANSTVTLVDEHNTVVGTGTTDADGHWAVTVGQGVTGLTGGLAEGTHALHAEIAVGGTITLPFLFPTILPNTLPTTTPTLPTTLPTVVVAPTVLAGTALTLTIDTTAPAAPAAPVLDPTSDNGTAGDNITTVRTPLLSGHAEQNATVDLYDNGTLLGSTRADSNGVWSYQAGRLAVGAHALTAVQTDVAGNASEGGAALALTIKAIPPAAPPTVDGVPVTTAPVVTAGGTSGTSTVVPIVTAGRVEQTGAAGTADIPLASSSGAALLTAQVHTGFGLTASGAVTHSAASAAAELVAAITATGTAHGSTDLAHLTSHGQSFLSLLPANVSLLVQTVHLDGAATGSAVDLVAATGNAAGTGVALVLDGTGVAAGTSVTLNAIPFASVFGALNVTSSTHGQILSGDAAAQTFTVRADAAGKVLAGAGTDTLVFAAAPAATAGTSADVAAGTATVTTTATTTATTTTTLLHGGSGLDTAVFSGAAAGYTIDEHAGYVLVSSKAAPNLVAQVVNVESLQFGDQTVTLHATTAQTTLAGLYENVVGRQADVTGFDFWAGAEKAGLSLGTIAVDMLASTEGMARFGALTGAAGHDVGVLYEAIFGRAADAAGSDYWVGQMAKGLTLAQVADQLTHSVEIVGQQQAATAWDFSV